MLLFQGDFRHGLLRSNHSCTESRQYGILADRRDQRERPFFRNRSPAIQRICHLKPHFRTVRAGADSPRTARTDSEEPNSNILSNRKNYGIERDSGHFRPTRFVQIRRTIVARRHRRVVVGRQTHECRKQLQSERTEPKYPSSPRARTSRSQRFSPKFTNIRRDSQPSATRRLRKNSKHISQKYCPNTTATGSTYRT